MQPEKTITLKTNMTCDSCVAKVKPALESEGISTNLNFNMSSPDKTVQFMGGEVEQKKALKILKDLGYQASPLTKTTSDGFLKNSEIEEKKSFIEVFKPLLIIALFLLGTTALVEIKAGQFDFMRAMSIFMGAFFIVFSFFKFLDLSKFADAFGTYDILGKKSRTYAVAYPFIELALGISFILQFMPLAVNILTIFLMALGSLGVWQVLKKKQTIQCACLGTVFNLPMTKVTLFENTLMLVMAVVTVWQII